MKTDVAVVLMILTAAVVGAILGHVVRLLGF
jgi:hypothetical protein